MSGNSLLDKPEIEKILGRSITDFQITSGSNQGVGGSLLCIKVTLAEDGTVRHLIYKCLPPEAEETSVENEDSHYVIKHRVKSVFRVETCMYEKIFPLLDNLVSKRVKLPESASTLSVAVPQYISGFNDNLRNDYVCLEDLSPEGFIVQNKYKTLTFAEVSMVMQEIAKLHALTYFLLTYQGQRIFDEDERIYLLKHNCMVDEDPEIGAIFSQMFKNYFENSVELLKPRDSKLATQLQKFTETRSHHDFHVLRRANQELTEVTAFPCIIHGDIWTSNILFKYQNQSGNYRDFPVELKFIDFQLSRWSNTYEELTYFFWCCTTPQFRQQHLATLLSIYFNAFENTLKVIDFPMPVGFTKGRFLDQFEKSMLSAYCYMPFALSLQMKSQIDFANLKTQDSTEKIVARQDSQNQISWRPEIAKILKNDKILHKLRIANSPEALNRLEDLTREMLEMGKI